MTVEDDILENKFSEDARSPKLDREHILNYKLNSSKVGKLPILPLELQQVNSDNEQSEGSLKSVDTLNHELHITADRDKNLR